MTDYLKVLPQYLIPQRLLSSLMHRLMNARLGVFKDLFVRWFIGHFKVDMNIAQEPDPSAYATVNSFFTRALRPEARPLAPPGHVLSPADGAISALGDIQAGRVFQAKGHDYSLEALLGGRSDLAQMFEAGSFATIYLSPRDYHRVHAPVSGQLREMIHVPGRLFSVNAATTRLVPGLFARNERVISLFDTEQGPVAVILVGAIFVGSMETVWAGKITPPYGSAIRTWRYRDGEGQEVRLERGEELGRFNMGSTVILLFPAGAVDWAESLGPGSPVRMGETLGSIRPKARSADSGLTRHHQDPFDRLIIAQAMEEKSVIVSADGAFDSYAIQRIW